MVQNLYFSVDFLFWDDERGEIGREIWCDFGIYWLSSDLRRKTGDIWGFFDGGVFEECG